MRSTSAQKGRKLKRVEADKMARAQRQQSQTRYADQSERRYVRDFENHEALKRSKAKAAFDYATYYAAGASGAFGPVVTDKGAQELNDEIAYRGAVGLGLGGIARTIPGVGRFLPVPLALASAWAEPGYDWLKKQREE